MTRNEALKYIERIDGGHVDPKDIPKRAWTIAEAGAILAEWVRELLDAHKDNS